jgi:PKD repeat protein
MRLLYSRFSILIILLSLAVFSCTDEVEEGSRPKAADFTMTVNPINLQEITFTNESENATHYVWNFGDGTELSYEKDPVHAYGEPGSYTVTLNARSKGGSVIKSMPIVVEGNEAPNVVEGGDFSDPGKWTMFSAGMTLTTTEFVNGGLKFSNGAGPAQTNVLAFSTAEVEAGKTYKFSAKIKGSGASNTWFQVYMSNIAPTNGSDYNEGMYTGLSTWDGCGASAFNGNLSDLGCQAGAPGNGKGGIISFNTSGTIYIVFKGGSWDGSFGTDGITLDDVKLQEAEVDNLVVGGDMSDPEAWNISKTDATQTDTEFVDGGLKFSNGAGPAQTNVLVWTTVEVEAGKSYKFAASVKGSGANNSWLEVLFGTSEPVANSDYNDGLYTGLNTWDGCATSSFNGNIATLGCKAGASGTNQSGAITFANSGTVYLVFKGGSWDGSLGTDGIVLDNVQLVEVE